MKRVLIIIWTLALVAACTETPQALDSGKRPDTAAFQGSTGVAFTAPGWKQGDKTSWEQQLKTRTQNGQNDYNKVN
ncbi:MAG: hypothetical protein JWQ07_4865 [Ramlibacter sp.]|nr:hypothetical protein [Ramlibacter sp.]